MLPPFDQRGNLPPGIHRATWQEIVDRFGTTARRQELLAGLRDALEALAAAGCPAVYLGGSFVTSKEDPEDYDGCWEIDGVDAEALDPFLLLPELRAMQRARYRGDLFPVRVIAGVSRSGMLEFFQRDRDGRVKGIVALDPRSIGS